MILAKWDSPAPIESPSFKFCAVDSGDCGPAMWPSINQVAGAYEASLMVPAIVSDEECYLQLENGAGNKMRSPVFSLSRERCRCLSSIRQTLILFSSSCRRICP
ncbi:hypothetical protein DFH07DRAFT_829368 [Mycena maculata]|uniref:Uncharacterized protein n=1 Tax=Mycena maculata TaxID=230809 RepID=A0AAD7IU04_9AGAR|nr:hypothetical protein DFH07DRAFT_829368 [Mycena maculata]